MANRVDLDATFNQRFIARKIGAKFDPIKKVWFTTNPLVVDAWEKIKSSNNYSRGPSEKSLNEKYTTRKQITNRMMTLLQHRKVAMSKIDKANKKMGAAVMEFRRLELLLQNCFHQPLTEQERQLLEPPSLEQSVSQVVDIMKNKRLRIV